MLARWLVAVRWVRKKRYVRRWRAVSVRLDAMMRPVSRDRTQVLITNQERQTKICHTQRRGSGRVLTVDRQIIHMDKRQCDAVVFLGTKVHRGVCSFRKPEPTSQGLRKLQVPTQRTNPQTIHGLMQSSKQRLSLGIYHTFGESNALTPMHPRLRKRHRHICTD